MWLVERVLVYWNFYLLHLTEKVDVIFRRVTVCCFRVNRESFGVSLFCDTSVGFPIPLLAPLTLIRHFYVGPVKHTLLAACSSCF